MQMARKVLSKIFLSSLIRLFACDDDFLSAFAHSLFRKEKRIDHSIGKQEIKLAVYTDWSTIGVLSQVLSITIGLFASSKI